MRISRMRATDSRSITPHVNPLNRVEKGGIVLISLGILGLLAAVLGAGSYQPSLWLITMLVLTAGGGSIYFFVRYGTTVAGVFNNGMMFSVVSSRGWAGWVLFVVLTGFYILLYWFPEALFHLIRITDPLSDLLRGQPADQWFLYGTMYTLAILVMGIRAILRYRSSRYQIIRTASVMFFQTVFAYLIPGLLRVLNKPEFYFSYFWPLKYDYLFPGTVSWLLETPGALGRFMVYWTVIMSFIATPLLTWFFGKRWYCSWVCGCGALAETFGDPFRHLSDKSRRAWTIERVMIYAILAFIIITTALLWLNSFFSGSILGAVSQAFAQWYGFFIGALFSGVVGVGFYSLLGTRVWCRFGCPLAAILGILQKYASRFRISTNGAQCMSCGNCSTYCEMGIDVRWYAQKGQNIIRASCVGCGICAYVCPRGVLNLESGPREGRYLKSLELIKR